MVGIIQLNINRSEALLFLIKKEQEEKEEKEEKE